jgi:hypothetical protein
MEVSISDEKVIKTGDIVSYDGISVTINDIFEDAIQVNGVIVNLGKTKKVGGLEVYVDDIAYHSSDTKPSKAVIQIGKDLSKSISDGDAYDKDEDEPTWVWTINNPGQKDGYIGIRYDKKQIDSEDDLVYSGGSYNFPEGYASVRFDKLTDVDYGEFDLSFDDSKDLYYNIEENNTKMYEDAKVLVLKGPTEDSFLVNGVESNEIYLRYNEITNLIVQNNSGYQDFTGYFSNKINGNTTINQPSPNEPNSVNCTLESGTFWNNETGVPPNNYVVDNNMSICTKWVEDITYTNEIIPMVEIFSNDINKDYSDSEKPRFTMNVSGEGIQNIGKLIYGDTELDIVMNLNGTSRTLSVGDLSVTINGNGDFMYLGSEDEDAESKDVILEGKNIGTSDNDNLLSHEGITVKSVESNADEDEVEFSVPEEQVYGEVTISNTEITTITPNAFGTMIVKDTEIESVKNNNLIVIGGSCINKAAATLLGVAENTCGVDFTTATGIGSGQYLVKEYTSPYNSGKTAFLVAGFEAGDTTSAINSIVSQG